MQRLLDEDRRLVPELVSTSERFKDPFIDVNYFVENWWAMPAKSYVDHRYVSESFWGPSLETQIDVSKPWHDQSRD
jgi:hypothetical protein